MFIWRKLTYFVRCLDDAIYVYDTNNVSMLYDVFIVRMSNFIKSRVVASVIVQEYSGFRTTGLLFWCCFINKNIREKVIRQS